MLLPALLPSPAPSAPLLPLQDHGGDSFAPLRRCQTSCLKCLVISKYLSILFAMLPSIYLSCIVSGSLC